MDRTEYYKAYYKKNKKDILKKTKLERHHWRYDKPKLFATLCEKCHKIQHRRKLL